MLHGIGRVVPRIILSSCPVYSSPSFSEDYRKYAVMGTGMIIQCTRPGLDANDDTALEGNFIFPKQVATVYCLLYPDIFYYF